MELEVLRENFEFGLMHAVETLADYKTRGIACESDYGKIRGMLSAAMYMDVIDIPEYRRLCDEVARWQFSC